MTIEDLNTTTERFSRTTKQPVIEHYKRPRNNKFVVVIFYVIGIIAVSILMKVI
jgi:hypothetical protein